MATSRQSRLQLNPGEPRRRPASLHWCFFWTTTSFLLVALVILKLFEPHRAIERVQTPHSNLYHDATVANRTEVIRPLVNGKEKFDIIASVWVRDIEEQGGKESMLHSDVVFRGVTLKSKGLMSAMEVKVPTAIFKRANLTNFYLRGSFTLIPSNNLLLNNTVRYMSWIPDEVVIPPSLPLGQNPPLFDEIINQYSLNIPLVEFHPTQSTCQDEGSEIFPTDEDIEEVQHKDRVDRSVYRTNEGMNTLLGHPYLVTRSHIRAADFTQMLKYDEFSKAHAKFRQRSCGQGTKNATVLYHSCQGNQKLSENGLFKTTILELRIPDLLEKKEDSKSVETRTEWVYTPFLSYLRTARGPMDLQRVPVNRELDCKNVSQQDEEFVAIKWKITFSGRSPLKMWVGDKLEPFHIHLNMSDPEYNVIGQNWAEVKDGVYGHRYGEDAHPRIYLGIKILQFMGEALIRILNFLYWYPRVSSVGISIPGYILTLSAELLDIALVSYHNFRYTYKHSGDVDGSMSELVLGYLWATVFSVGPIWVIMNLLKLKAIMRVQITHDRDIFPTFKRFPANHAERASARMDGRMSWAIRISAAIFLAIFIAFMRRSHISINAPTLPVDLLALVTETLHHMGIISQLILNHRARTFAGMYKLTLYLMLVNSLLWIIPARRFLVSQGVMEDELMDFNHYVVTILQLIMMVQAVRYSYAKYNAEEDSD